MWQTKYASAVPKNFGLGCLECISRNGVSFGHSDWRPSSVYLEIRLEIQAITFKKKETSEGLLPTYFRGHSLTTLTRVWGFFWLRACQRSPRNYYFGLLTFCLRFVSHLPKLKGIAPCYVTRVLYDMNWQDCLRQVKTCLVFFWCLIQRQVWTCLVLYDAKCNNKWS